MAFALAVLLASALAGAAGDFAMNALPDNGRPPVAPRHPRTMNLHGESIADDYWWLREKANPEVMRYLKAEDAFASAWMAPTEALRKSLYDELLGRIQEDDLSVPYRKNGYWYYSKTEKGKQYPTLCRKRGSLEAPEQIVLDMNLMAQGHPFFSIDTYEPSDDGNLLLYSTDTTGFREYTLRARDLRTGRDLPLEIPRVSSAAWAADGKTLFYVVDDDTKRPYRLYRLALGKELPGTLVFEEKDERFNVGVSRTRSQAFVLASVDSHTQTEIRFLPANTPNEAFRIVLPRQTDLEYDVEHGGDLFYIRVNDTGRNFRLVTTPVATPGREHWTEIVPHRPEVMLRGVDVFAMFYALLERENAVDRIRIVDRASGADHAVAFPEAAYAIFPHGNAEYETPGYRFQYQSLITPATVYEHDVATRDNRLLKRQPVLGGFDSANYALERLMATAADGAKIPITIAYRKDTFRRDGTSPMQLVGYGSYGIGLPVTFASNKVSLMDRGIVVGIAHVRGGNERGKPWHDQGRMMSKRNTFTDFVACAEHLIAAKVAANDGIVIEGGSAGGLLLGAVLNLRPDLFKAAILKVPFVDVINTMYDTTLPLTVGEFEEWGNPRIEAEYRYMKTYCPYTNVAARAYPAMLIKTSTDDSQVMYWEPAKYVAKLRRFKTDANPLLFKINFTAGHGGSSGRYDALRETAFDYAFLLTQVGRETIAR